MKKPSDPMMQESMRAVALELCREVDGCKLAYGQSDEISLVLTEDTISTEPWFNKEVQKVVSVTASIATAAFNRAFTLQEMKTGRHEDKVGRALFDSRVFVLPNDEEVVNYFIWRQQDATRNAIQALAQAHFSHREIHGYDMSELQEALFTYHKINFNDCETSYKRGFCSIREYYTVEDAQRSRCVIDEDIPIFTEDRAYITDKL
jgi:tRNA(His) 5'-end guanylyltransferase